MCVPPANPLLYCCTAPVLQVNLLADLAGVGMRSVSHNAPAAQVGREGGKPAGAAAARHGPVAEARPLSLARTTLAPLLLLLLLRQPFLDVTVRTCHVRACMCPP